MRVVVVPSFARGPLQAVQLMTRCVDLIWSPCWWSCLCRVPAARLAGADVVPPGRPARGPQPHHQQAIRRDEGGACSRPTHLRPFCLSVSVYVCLGGWGVGTGQANGQANGVSQWVRFWQKRVLEEEKRVSQQQVLRRWCSQVALSVLVVLHVCVRLKKQTKRLRLSLGNGTRSAMIRSLLICFMDSSRARLFAQTVTRSGMQRQRQRQRQR